MAYLNRFIEINLYKILKPQKMYGSVITHIYISSLILDRHGRLWHRQEQKIYPVNFNLHEYTNRFNDNLNEIFQECEGIFKSVYWI